MLSNSNKKYFLIPRYGLYVVVTPGNLFIHIENEYWKPSSFNLSLGSTNPTAYSIAVIALFILNTGKETISTKGKH